MTIDDVKAELARGQAEAVRMLDAWAALAKGRSWEVRNRNDGCWQVLLMGDFKGTSDGRLVLGDSPEAARANAAEAIRGELIEKRGDLAPTGADGVSSRDHAAALGAIAKALGMPGATVPEMVARIEKIRGAT